MNFSILDFFDLFGNMLRIVFNKDFQWEVLKLVGGLGGNSLLQGFSFKIFPTNYDLIILSWCKVSIPACLTHLLNCMTVGARDLVDLVEQTDRIPKCSRAELAFVSGAKEGVSLGFYFLYIYSFNWWWTICCWLRGLGDWSGAGSCTR